MCTEGDCSVLRQHFHARNDINKERQYCCTFSWKKNLLWFWTAALQISNSWCFSFTLLFSPWVTASPSRHCSQLLWQEAGTLWFSNHVTQSCFLWSHGPFQQWLVTFDGRAVFASSALISSTAGQKWLLWDIHFHPEETNNSWTCSVPALCSKPCSHELTWPSCPPLKKVPVNPFHWLEKWKLLTCWRQRWKLSSGLSDSGAHGGP